MEIISYHKGQTIKTAIVAGAGPDEKEAAKAFAMQHAGEKPHNLFGTNCHYSDGKWRIEMFTD